MLVLGLGMISKLAQLFERDRGYNTDLEEMIDGVGTIDLYIGGNDICFVCQTWQVRAQLRECG